MLVESLTELFLILIVQVLPLNQDLRFEVGLRMKRTLPELFSFPLQIHYLWIELLLTSRKSLKSLASIVTALGRLLGCIPKMIRCVA